MKALEFRSVTAFLLLTETRGVVAILKLLGSVMINLEPRGIGFVVLKLNLSLVLAPSSVASMFC